MTKVLVALTGSDSARFESEGRIAARLGKDGDCQEVCPADPESLAALILTAQIEVLVTGWQTPALASLLDEVTELPLKYVCHLAGTVKPLVSRVLIERGVLVTNWGSAISRTVAEHAVLLILGALRNVLSWRPRIVAADAGQDGIHGASGVKSLIGKRVGIHGFGAIGREVAHLLKPFGVSLSGYSGGVPGEIFHAHGVRPCATLEELFSTSDVLVECEALTPRSRGSVTAEVLSRLPGDAVFVNVGRGAAVDEKALFDLASRGAIRVALDVFAREPLTADSPWLRLPNALISPHIAGPTNDTYSLCTDFVLKNLRHYLSGQLQLMEGVVTLEVYDRIT